MPGSTTIEDYLKKISVDKVVFYEMHQFERIDIAQIDFENCVVTTEMGTRAFPIADISERIDRVFENQKIDDGGYMNFMLMQVALWKVLEVYMYSNCKTSEEKAAKYNEMVRTNYFIGAWFTSDTKVNNYIELIKSHNLENVRNLDSPSVVDLEIFVAIVTSKLFPIWEKTLKEVCPNVCAKVSNVFGPFERAVSTLIQEHIQICYILIPRGVPHKPYLESVADVLLDSLESGLEFAKYLTAFREETKFIFLTHFVISEIRFSLAIPR